MSDYDVNIQTVTLGPTGLTIPINGGRQAKWLMIANNNVSGSATGVTVTADVTPQQGIQPVIPYGTVQSYPLPRGIVFLALFGNGANISVIVNDKQVPLQVTTVVLGGAAPAGIIPTDVGQQALGAIDPRQIRDLSAGTDSILIHGSYGEPLIQDSIHYGLLIAALNASSAPQTMTMSNDGPLWVRALGNNNLVEKEAGTSSVAASTAATVIKAGVSTVPLGALVTWSLAASGQLINYGGIIMAVYLQGHTSGSIYAVACCSTSSAAQFFMPVAEAIDVYVINGDSVSHGFIYSWQAMSVI
jgi:hypothetical protein